MHDLLTAAYMWRRRSGRAKTRISDRHRLSSVLDPVQATSEKFENVALSQRLGLPSTLIRHEKELFLKTLGFKPEKFENDGFEF